MKKYLIYILILVEALVLSYLIYIKGLKAEDINSEDIVNIQQVDIQDNWVQETEGINNEYIFKQSGWLPPWYFEESFNSLKSYSEIIDVVNPVIYGINTDGTLLVRVKGISEFVSYCKSNNILVVPTIGSYGYESTNWIFKDMESYMEHVQDILSEVDKYNYDGVDIDYEVISKDKKDMYISFLKELSLELDKRDKILSVTVFAKTSDTIDYGDHSDTRYVQEYSLIGGIADEVRIMTYDYTLPNSNIPGPNAPIDWVEKVIQYSLDRIPKEKIWVGIPLYGYRWKDGKSSALTQSSLLSVINNSNIKKEYREDIGEIYSEYSCDSTKCYVYYLDSKGIQLRKDLAMRYELAGVSYWSVGRDEGVLLQVR